MTCAVPLVRRWRGVSGAASCAASAGFCFGRRRRGRSTAKPALPADESCGGDERAGSGGGVGRRRREGEGLSVIPRPAAAGVPDRIGCQRGGVSTWPATSSPRPEWRRHGHVALAGRRRRRYPRVVSVAGLRGVVALAGRFPALAGVDLDVEPGEAVLLQGPNGAGKTTLLRLCAGLVELSAGSATVFGHDLGTRSGRRLARRFVGLVGHASFLYDDLTAWENTRFWARAAGADDDEVRAAWQRVGIEGRLRDLPVGSMSAGQQRRVSLAAVVARRPRLWLLDEPHAGLDQEGRDVVDQLVRDATKAGASVMIASHEIERARAIAPRAVTIAGGVVVDDSVNGPPHAA